MGNQNFCESPILNKQTRPAFETASSLFDRIGGDAFVLLVIEQLDFDKTTRRNCEVDLRGALTFSAPFDSRFTEPVSQAINALDEVSSELKEEISQAISDASITSAGKRCPLSGTLQRDETDMCPITKMGLTVAKDKTPLLEEIEGKCDRVVETWLGRIKEPSTSKAIYVEFLKSILERKEPAEIDFKGDVNFLLKHLKDALEEMEIRPMIIAEICNRVSDTLRDPPHIHATSDTADSRANSRLTESTKARDSDSLPEDSLLFRMGGESALDVFLDDMYDRILGHKDLSVFFTDPESVKRHQKQFLSSLLKDEVPEMNLKNAHAKIPITEKIFDQFNQMVAQSACKLFDVTLVQELLEVFTRYERIVVRKKKTAPKPFVLFPSNFNLPKENERRYFTSLGCMHWPISAREDMKKEIRAKFRKINPDGKHNFVNEMPSLGANLTLEGAHVPMARPTNVKCPPDFRHKVGVLSIEELAEFRATNARKLMSVYGLIFDVSDRPDKYAVGSPYEELTGKDITWGLACGDDSPYNANKFYDMFKRPERDGGDILNKGKKSPDYDALYVRIAGLLGWIEHFKQEYGDPVGELDLYLQEDALSFPPEIEVGCCIM